LAVVEGKLMDTKPVLEYTARSTRAVLWGKIPLHADSKAIFEFSKPDSDATAILFDPSHTNQPFLDIFSKDLCSNL